MPTRSGLHIPDWAHGFELHTARLLLAPCDSNAAVALAEIIADEQVHEPYFVGRLRSTLPQTATEAWLQTPDRWRDRHQFSLAVRLRDSGSVIGCVQFTPHNVGYFVAPRFWRQGLGREMVAASCQQIAPLLGIGLLETSVIRENLASRRILEQSGFTFSGLLTRNLAGRTGQASMLHYRRNLAVPVCTIRRPTSISEP